MDYIVAYEWIGEKKIIRIYLVIERVWKDLDCYSNVNLCN